MVQGDSRRENWCEADRAGVYRGGGGGDPPPPPPKAKKLAPGPQCYNKTYGGGAPPGPAFSGGGGWPPPPPRLCKAMYGPQDQMMSIRTRAMAAKVASTARENSKNPALTFLLWTMVWDCGTSLALRKAVTTGL